MAKFDGKVAFITGAGRGQGRSHALALAREGADIVVVDIGHDLETSSVPLAKRTDMEETVKMVEDLDRRAVMVEADIGDRQQVRAAVETAVNEFGHIDILCNNAGILSTSRVVDMTDEQWDEMLRTNLTGVFNVSRAVAPIMVEQRSGRIINTASVDGLQVLAYDHAHYIAAKHGVVGFTRALAVELAEYNVTVNAVCPTGVDTPMINLQPDMSEFDKAIEISGPMTLFPDVGMVEPKDISAAVVFLASPEARYITGHALPVDGGFTIK